MTSRSCTSLACLLSVLALQATGCNAILGIDEPPPGTPGGDDGGLDQGDDPVDGGPLGPGMAHPDGAVAHEAGVQPVPDPHSFASWPMPNPLSSGTAHALSYDLTSASVVTDKVTGLRWQRAASTALYSWEEGKKYCEALVVDGKSYRLPTRIELLSLLDPTRIAPAIDSQAFPSTASEPFWSSSSFAGGRADAWSIDFGYSTSSVLTKWVEERLHVRCVERAEVARSEPVMPVVADGTVYYPKTDLTWQAEEAPEAMDWPSAVQYCAALQLGGTGWRLPTLKELHVLVDETRVRPAIQSAMSSRDGAEQAWSATDLARFPRSAWALNAAAGNDVWFPKSTKLAVRCVR